MNLVDELHAVAAAFAAAGIRYAVCGGVAVTIHGATRSTKDLDILIAPEDLARAIEAVKVLGFAYPALPMTFGRGTPAERHVQRISKIAGTETLTLDLILADAAFDGALADRLEIELPTGTLAVVSRATLIRMKRLAGRAQDVADIEKLEGGDEG